MITLISDVDKKITIGGMCKLVGTKYPTDYWGGLRTESQDPTSNPMGARNPQILSREVRVAGCGLRVPPASQLPYMLDFLEHFLTRLGQS